MNLAKVLVLTLAVAVSAGFYWHLFAGMLAVGAAGIAGLVRCRHDRRALAFLGGGVALAFVLAMPRLLLAFDSLGAARASVLLWGPGQYELGGLRLLNPLSLARSYCAPVLLMGICALFIKDSALWSARARVFCVVGAGAAALILLTPLYHLLAATAGGWMAPRILVLGFFWIGAAVLVLEWLSGERGRGKFLIALALCGLVFWTGAARVARDLRVGEIYFPVSARARLDARALRAELEDEEFISAPRLAYVLAPLSGGRPLAVPPGQASAVHPFEQRVSDLQALLASSSIACWKDYLARYPSLRFMVTPAGAAQTERELWQAAFGSMSPEQVAQTLQEAGLLSPVRGTETFDLWEFNRVSLAGMPGAQACSIEWRG